MSFFPVNSLIDFAHCSGCCVLDISVYKLIKYIHIYTYVYKHIHTHIYILFCPSGEGMKEDTTEYIFEALV